MTCSVPVSAKMTSNKTRQAYPPSLDQEMREAQTGGLLFGNFVRIIAGNTPAMPLNDAHSGGFFYVWSLSMTAYDKPAVSIDEHRAIPRESHWDERVVQLLDRYLQVSRSHMGFLADWDAQEFWADAVSNVRKGGIA